MMSRPLLSSWVLCAAFIGCGSKDVAATHSAKTATPTTSASVSLGAPVNEGSLFSKTQTLSFGLVLPNTPTEAQQATLRGRIQKLFPDLKVVATGGKLASGSVGVAFTSAQDSPLSHLTRNAHGLDEDAVSKLGSTGTLVWLSWALEGDGPVPRVKAVDEAIDALAKESQAAVVDMTTVEIFSADAWHSERVATWVGDNPSAKHHFKIDYRPDGDRNRAVTHGLGAFALPDLVIADLPFPDAKRGAAFINGVAQLLVEGTTVGPNRTLEIDFARIRYAKEGPSAPANRPPVVIHVTLASTPKGKDDSDNYLYELRFPGYPGATETERLTAALDAAFGAEVDEPTKVAEGDAELIAIKARVQAKLPSLHERFARGVPPGEHVSVKVPFEVDGGGASERMWVVVTSWSGTKIHGTLNNDPTAIKSLRAGAHVDVEQADVVDYTWQKKDGTREGGETIDALSRRK